MPACSDGGYASCDLQHRQQETGADRQKQAFRLRRICFGLLQIALHSRKLGFQNRGRGDPQNPTGLFGEADGFLGLPHRARPVADFHFGPSLGKKHAREFAEPPLCAQRGAELGKKAYAEIESANDIGGASEDSRDSRIAACLFQKAPGA